MELSDGSTVATLTLAVLASTILLLLESKVAALKELLPPPGDTGVPQLIELLEAVTVPTAAYCAPLVL